MLSYSSRPPDPALVGERWRAMWLERLENEPFLPALWHAHQTRDAYWKRGSVCEDYAAIEAAVLSIGGWHDGYRNTVSHLVENVPAPVKGIVGPWIHKYPHFAAPEPRIGFLQEALRWWDRWLKGVDTGVEHDPAYRAWLMDSVRPARWHAERPGRWIAEKAWPSPSIEHARDRAAACPPRPAPFERSSPRRRIAASPAASTSRSISAPNCRATSARRRALALLRPTDVLCRQGRSTSSARRASDLAVACRPAAGQRPSCASATSIPTAPRS
jgi:predicted acyl esterase